MALDTVQDYLDRARVLLLDEVEPFRYPTSDLVENLNMGVMEMRRIRPDIMQAHFRTSLPDFGVSTLTDTVPVDPQYRVALLYYICGHAHLRDEEGTQDTRAAALLNKFVAQMTTIQA